MTEFDLVTLGAINVDELRRVNSFRPDGETYALDAARAGGGSHANTALALARLGHRVAVLGAVGEHATERGILDDLEADGIHTDWVVEKPGTPTGEALIVNSPEGRSIIITPGANSHYSIADAHTAASEGATRTRMLHLTSFVGQEAGGEQLAAQEYLVGQLQPETLVTFAPGELYAALGVGGLATLLNRTDHLIGNAREISTLAGEPEYNYVAAARTLLDRFKHIQAVAVTLGSGRHRDDYYRSEDHYPSGFNRLTISEQLLGKLDPILSSVIVTRADRIDTIQKPFSGDVIDSTGAGDAWTAGYLHGLLSNQPLATCAKLGEAVARHSLTQAGARAGLPALSQLQENTDAAR